MPRDLANAISMFVALAASTSAQPQSSALELANPLFGVDGGGNTVPGAAVPFGFVSLSPDTTDGSTSGYGSNGLIIGFSATHVSGTGGAGKYGNFRVTPAIGDEAWGNRAFPKSREEARPGYYAATIGRPGKEIRAELTASRLAAFERFAFPAASDARIILDASATIPLGGGGPRCDGGSVTAIDSRHVASSMTCEGGWGKQAPYTLHLYAEFDRPAVEFGRWTSKRGSFARVPGPGTSAGGDTRKGLDNGLGAYATFDTRQNRTVRMRVGVSFVSVEQARRNLGSASFDEARAQAEKLWADALGTVEVEGGTGEQRRIFYSALYRGQLMPHDLSGENVWWRSDEPHYEDFFTIWDTFRTVNPLLTLIQPQRERDMVRSLLDTYRHTGWLPDARIAGATGPSQGGSNGDVLIADAIVKGLGGFDEKLALEALLKDGDVQSDDPMNHGRELKDYLSLGYMSLSQTRSASRTLEYAFDDYAIASAAAKLGRRDIAKRYAARSRAWTNLWDPKLHCIHPRYADGRWLENFDCGHEYPDQTAEWWDHPFYEGSSRQYSTFVPHNVGGLMQQLGGKERFVGWLDSFFDERAYNHGNEPDILAPWFYIHAGRPDRTAERVRSIMAEDYHDRRDGLPGNDDAGTLSAWYVWAAIGLFPNAGQPFYYIGSPVFSRSMIHLEHGRSFVIEAPEASAADLYVQSAELNGNPLDRAWLTHEEVAKGGKLVLHMGPHPSGWATNSPPPLQLVKP
ncbi:MAG: GH92 family glycosyl hydrolase [Novosphingobium sp.]|nr:GH92 family glycosyl hydrolase [Novosphingobium sp.]